MNPLDHAQVLGQRGYKVFFCKSDKSPTCPGGFHSASDDPGTLFELYWLYPGPLVATATGAASGVDVLDIDIKHLAARDWLHRNTSRLPATRTHATRGGGRHLLLRHHQGMRSSISRIVRGVDVRADGGYAVWWPAAGLPVLCDATLAVWPDWLVALAEARVATELPEQLPIISDRPIVRSTNAYAETALHRAVQRILSAPNGRQEQVINREAFSIGTLIGAECLRKKRRIGSYSPSPTRCRRLTRFDPGLLVRFATRSSVGSLKACVGLVLPFSGLAHNDRVFGFAEHLRSESASSWQGANRQ
jgi:hypothetical protein